MVMKHHKAKRVNRRQLRELNRLGLDANTDDYRYRESRTTRDKDWQAPSILNLSNSYINRNS